MSDKPDIFMPLFLGDFTKHIARLKDAAVGSYILILMDYWINGAPPDDDEILATVARCPPKEWPKRRRLLAPFFQITDGYWRQKRVEQELAKATGRKEKAQGAADARWRDAPSIPRSKPKPRKGDAPSMPQASPEHMLGACPSPSPGSLPVPIEPGRHPRRDTPPLPAEGQAALTREEKVRLDEAEARGRQGPGVASLRRRFERFGMEGEPPPLRVVSG